MTTTNPWGKFKRDHFKGEIVTGPISKITDYGLFVDLNFEVFGIVHLNDLDWNNPGEDELKQYIVGDTIDSIILSIEPVKERISLGVKQLRKGPGRGSDSAPPDPLEPNRPLSPKPPNSKSEAAKQE